MNPYNRPYDEETGEPSDLDQNNPVDLTKEEWQDIYSDWDYDLDNDHSMDY